MKMEDSTSRAEGGGVGGREGGSRKSKEGVTLVRIDHSDVYIENDRLNDELAHSLDTIHRNGYKKLMNCDFEITAIRKSLLRMRKDNPKLHESKRSKFSRSPRSRTLLTRATKTKAATTANDNPPPKETNNPANVIRKDALQGSRQRTPGTPLKSNSIEIKMPRTNFHHENDDTSSSDSDENDNDNNDNDDNDDDSGSDSMNSDNDANDDDDEIDGRGFSNRHHGNNTTGTSTNTITNSTTRRSCFNSRSPGIVTSMRIKDDGDVITSGDKPKSASGGGGSGGRGGKVKHRGDLLKNLMSRLNLDKVPPAWYTDVVPASDVHVSKRYVVGSAGSGRDRDRKSRRGRGRNTGTGRYGSKKQHPTAAVRPATTSGDIFSRNNAQAFNRNNNNNDDNDNSNSNSNNNQRRNGNMNNTLKQRPFTSLGLKSNNNSYHANTRTQNNDSRCTSKQAFGNNDNSNISNNINNNTHMKLKSENMLNGNDNNNSSSSYHRERPMTNVMKTVRQLKEEALGAPAARPQSAVEVLLQEAKVERTLIEDRVRSFVRSLEEGKKTERLKKMMSRSILFHSQQQNLS